MISLVRSRDHEGSHHKHHHYYHHHHTIIIIIIITITTTTIIINHQHQVKYYTRSPQICEVSTNFLSNIQ